MAHVTEAQWKGMRDGTLCGDAYLEVLSHIGECDECALHLAEGMEEKPLLKAPQGMGQAVKQKLLKPSEAAVKSYRTYRRRVLLAMCATLILVFSGVFTQFSRLPVDKISEAHTSFSIKFKEGFSAFSQKLWIMEEHNNEKTEK